MKDEDDREIARVTIASVDCLASPPDTNIGLAVS